jgi:effector-binding domain-containing protein
MNDTIPAGSEGPSIVTLEPQVTAIVREELRMDSMAPFFDRAYTTLTAELGRQGVAITAPAFAFYFSPPGETVDVGAGFPTDRAIESAGEVVPHTLPGGLAARYTHAGAYERLPQAYERLIGWMTEHGHAPGTVMWEIYVTEPSPEADPESMITELVWPLAN